MKRYAKWAKFALLLTVGWVFVSCGGNKKGNPNWLKEDDVDVAIDESQTGTYRYGCHCPGRQQSQQGFSHHGRRGEANHAGKDNEVGTAQTPFPHRKPRHRL